jgi:hypothetical protein
MSSNKKIRGINRKLRQKALGDRDVKLFHSRSYHSYFEGYQEYKEVNSRGRTKIRRVYTGTWYSQDLDTARYILLRLLYVLLFFGIIGMLVLAAISQKESGNVLYVVIPEILTVGLLFRMLYILFVNYLFAPGQMTLNDYRTTAGSLKICSLALAISFGLDMSMSILYAIIHLSDVFGKEMLIGLEFLTAGILSLAMFFIERRIPYKEIKNDSIIKENGIEIES